MARIIDQFGNTETVSDRDFFTMAFGHPPKTREQREAEWNAEVERYVEQLQRGCEPDSYGNPAVIEAKKRIAERELLQLTVAQIVGKAA
jgi:hypothetical protein